MKKILFLSLLLLTKLVAFAQDSSIVFSPKRLVKLEGGSNFRDLGGYPTTDGKSVKWGHIFRSSDISKLTDNDLATLQSLNLVTICDFRGPDEVKNSPDRLPLGVNYLNLQAGSQNIKMGQNVAPHSGDSLLFATYTSTEFFKAKYKPMFDQLLILTDDKSLMFHCTAGKDRTGMAAALVLSALGVEQKYIVADYTATNVFWKDTREKMFQAMTKRGMNADAVKSLLAAKSSYIESFFNAINTKYGSMNDFLRTEMELSPEKILLLKSKYLN